MDSSEKIEVDLKNEIYDRVLRSPLDVAGVEQTLPELETLACEIRTRRFWEQKQTRRRLKNDRLASIWPTCQRDARELRLRMRQPNQSVDSLVSWLVDFTLSRMHELVHISAFDVPQFQLALNGGSSGGWSPENSLAMQRDFQTWLVAWLRDVLLDEALDIVPPKVGANGVGGDDDGSSEPALRPVPKPGSDTPDLDF